MHGRQTDANAHTQTHMHAHALTHTLKYYFKTSEIKLKLYKVALKYINF